MKLLGLIPLERGRHKFRAVFDDGTHTTFGARGYDDFTTHHDVERRDRYRKRHAKDLKTGDPTRAGYLSYYLLWGDSTSLEKNIKQYRKMFDM